MKILSILKRGERCLTTPLSLRSRKNAGISRKAYECPSGSLQTDSEIYYSYHYRYIFNYIDQIYLTYHINTIKVDIFDKMMHKSLLDIHTKIIMNKPPSISAIAETGERYGY